MRPTPTSDLLLALNVAPGIPRAAACRLAARPELWLGEPCPTSAAGELGVPASVLAAARALARAASGPARAERDALRSAGATIWTLADPEYPERLRALELPPPALYVRGAPVDGPAVAIVGARRASPYGLEVAGWLARELAAAGVAVVSGFAVGVDAAAHQGALAAPGGRTLAVLGCGLDIDYPRGQRGLAAAIAGAGAVVSEFPLGRLPARWQFPVRNRLIAALADACVVVEAAPRSGSLVTARLALELGRSVLAVPGRVTDELALGVNALLADGARPALDPRDVLEELGLAAAEPARASDEPPPGLGNDARALWLAARAAPAPAEALAARCALPVDRVLVLLLELELAARLRRAPSGAYEACG
jgi:DNA processing protein